MSTQALVKPKGPRLSFKHGVVELAHGSGGRAMMNLIDQGFKKFFKNPYLSTGDDSACLPIEKGTLVMTTDSYVVSPLFFPGGNIGDLAIHGTVNDLAMLGATPRYLSVGFILEAGFPLSDLKTIIATMADKAAQACVHIVTGDTKVVEKGHGDGVFINTTGIGFRASHITLSGSQAKIGDKIIISGSIANHGMAIMSQRQGLSFDIPCLSDTANLSPLVQTLLSQFDNKLRCFRDPTRGGVATTLNEIAQQSQVGMMIDESKVPIREDVHSACELLGLDPFYLANEGIFILICAADTADYVLDTINQDSLGQQAAIIGEVVSDPNCFVQLRTTLGGMRVMDLLSGEPLPRIC